MRVLITRPRARSLELARELEARGDTALIDPLLTIEPIAEVDPDLARAQAVVLTSAHAVPALRGAAGRLPVFAVGDATAAAARRAGCAPVVSAAGDGRDLAALIAARCRPELGDLVHLGGEQVRAGLAEGLAAAGFRLRRQTVYRAVAADALAPETVEALAAQRVDAVLLFSPRTAATFTRLIARHGLQDRLTATAAICLSAAVAQPCRELVWRAIYLAARPARAALLEALEAFRRRC